MNNMFDSKLSQLLLVQGAQLYGYSLCTLSLPVCSPVKDESAPTGPTHQGALNLSQPLTWLSARRRVAHVSLNYSRDLSTARRR